MYLTVQDTVTRMGMARDQRAPSTDTLALHHRARTNSTLSDYTDYKPTKSRASVVRLAEPLVRYGDLKSASRVRELHGGDISCRGHESWSHDPWETKSRHAMARIHPQPAEGRRASIVSRQGQDEARPDQASQLIQHITASWAGKGRDKVQWKKENEGERMWVKWFEHSSIVSLFLPCVSPTLSFDKTNVNKS
ncbi:hypothetical protein NM208_g16815 [Fusarium decemcellulare]|uniref:Uncharacterized protein n=1 Tax=Fusarium decemcellulare TaxID=57161 RepID=A0ACC1RAI0_9HYPO|nr:hypothetical protein NM208_g16815 [Fusarium decemcellulare]